MSAFFEDSLVLDCPICLDPMEEEDYQHILMCERHCGYNFCKNCIESLLRSSKDDFQEASDGNIHVKVFLRCPNCRSDLTATIRDTLLLRKAHAVKRLQKTNGDLDDSQKRLEKVLHTDEVKEAIKKAREEETAYMGQEFTKACRSPSIFSDSTAHSFPEEASLDVEEWGVEADLYAGVHDSFRMPTPLSPVKRQLSVMSVDKTLFSAWDDSLNDIQRRAITAQMTSGDTNMLAKAALTLYNVLHDIAESPQPAMVTSPRSSLRQSKRCSVLDLIAESKAVHDSEEKKLEEIIESPTSAPPMSRLWSERGSTDYEVRHMAAINKQFPLPVRMPKAVEARTDSLDLELIDYIWDGTIVDAYRKISIGFRDYIHQKDVENRAVQRILGEGNYGQVELPGKHRVLILSAGELGRQGAVRGDVVTHVDSESVGDLSAEQILSKIKEKGPRVMITLNAERSVAEALRRRAIAIKERS